MLEGKALILATKPFAKENIWASWYYTLSTLSLLISANFFIFYFESIILKILFGILTALLNARMFVIYHDYLHKAILHKSTIAKILFTSFGWHLLATPSIWKRSHDYHHNNNCKLYTTSIGSYPIVTLNKFNTFTDREKKNYLLTRSPITICLGYFTMFIFGMCISSFINNPRKHTDSLMAFLLHLSFCFLIVAILGWIQLVCSVLIPYGITGALGAYLFYAQHNFPGVQHSENVDWKYETAALHSSSFMNMNSLMNWFTANIGYHHIHHLNSRIPFYRLPEAMVNIPELQNPIKTSLGIKDIMACLRLKVWDSSQKKMVNTKGV